MLSLQSRKHRQKIQKNKKKESRNSALFFDICTNIVGNDLRVVPTGARIGCSLQIHMQWFFVGNDLRVVPTEAHIGASLRENGDDT